MRLKDKIAIVTGAASGIGRATAVLFAQEGAQVIATDVNDAGGEETIKQINQSGGRGKYYHLDVSQETAVADVFQKVIDEFGHLDVLFNNAGIAGTNKPTDELTEEEWNQVLDINLKGVFFCEKYALRQMKKQKSGSIINNSSIYGIIGAPDVPPYHASKGAVRLLTKTDALIYAKYNIRVNSVHPGFIWTPMVENFVNSAPDPAATKEYINNLHPLGHIGEPNDIAYGVLYLASDEAKFVTGTELIIDGGYTAR